MNEFLDSIKVDLLDSRRRPLLIAAVVLLVGAIAYASLAGGSSSGVASSAPVPEPSLPVSGIHPTQAQPSKNQAVAETTSGVAKQHLGGTRDPFTLLPGANKQAASGTSTSTTTATSTSGAPSPGTSAGSTGTGGGTKPATHVKSRTLYSVAVLFGKAKPGTPAQEAGLTPFEHLRQNQLIPNAKQPLVAFRGVLVGGESAAFTLVGEEAPILRGLGKCKPSGIECRTLDLKVGQTEELEYLPLSGAEAVTYELQVASIVTLTTVKTSHAAARAGTGVRSKRGSRLLRRLGLVHIPGLRYSQRRGVFVFTPFAAPGRVTPAHTAAPRGR
jgi:hypothetical protein